MSDEVFPCPNSCGPMRRHKCKLVCGVCGFFVDCGDYCEMQRLLQRTLYVRSDLRISHEITYAGNRSIAYRATFGTPAHVELGLSPLASAGPWMP